MIAGRDFPSLFDHDNFISRRTTGHNMYDPESLIIGTEIAAGFTYTNSARDWYAPIDYKMACYGHLTVKQIITLSPRIFINATPLPRHEEPTYIHMETI